MKEYECVRPWQYIENKSVDTLIKFEMLNFFYSFFYPGTLFFYYFCCYKKIFFEV